jgi:photosystem II stability/assembly factor-like uncharacterized protein
MLKTTNGGINWSSLNLSLYDVVNIFAASEDTVYFAKSNLMPPPTLYKSIDGGVTFGYVYSSSNLGYVYFINGTTGFSMSNYILKTTNGGYNWASTYYFPGLSILKTFFFLNATTGYIHLTTTSYPYNPTLTKTTNQGENWATTNISVSFQSMYFVNSLTGFGSGTRQVGFGDFRIDIFKTTDGGNNWSTQNTEWTSAQVTCVQFINQDTGYISTGYSIIKTTNCGQNWFQSYAGSCLIEKIQLVNRQIGYGICSHYIIKTTNAGPPISIENNNEKLPQSFSLSQNYPNPFNPVTKIKYDIPPSKGARGMMTQLIIYDILGREIETLVNETHKPGSYDVTWDGSRYASGVYFYRLITDEFTETKKMVLIK